MFEKQTKISEDRKSYGFETTRGWVNNDRILIFELTIPFKMRTSQMWSLLFQPKEAGSTCTQFLMIQSIRGMFVSTLHPPTEFALKTYKTEWKCCLMRSVLKNRQSRRCLSDSFLRVYEREKARMRNNYSLKVRM